MIVTTTETIPGKKITKVIGLVRGNSVRARHLGRDILAGFRNVVGGEISDYTKAIAETREQALDRMIESARASDANAVICMRFTTSSLMQGAAEILAFGTAVVVED